MVSSQVHISEPKLLNTEPFKEPEGMMTIELNKNVYGAGGNNEITAAKTKYKLDKGQIYKIVLGTVCFVTLGLSCMIVVIFIKHRGYFRPQNNPITPDHIRMCKTMQNSQNCCSIFVKEGLIQEIELCTVEKLLDIVLQYELKTNSRNKRQTYENTPSYNDFFYDEQNYFDNHKEPHKESDILNYAPTSFSEYQQPNELELSPDYNSALYFQQNPVDYVAKPQSNVQYPFVHVTENVYIPSHMNFDTEEIKANRNQNEPKNKKSMTQRAKIFENNVISTTPTTEVQVKITPLQSSKNNTANQKIKKINNHNKTKQICNNKKCTSFNATSTDIYVQKTNNKTDQARINQGTDFDMKTKIDNFPSTYSGIQVQPKQVLGQCYYPYPTPFASTYRVSLGVDGNPVFSIPTPTTPQVQQSQQSMFIINPQMYPYIPVNFYNNFQNQQMMNSVYLQNAFKNQMQFSSSPGQFYTCNPIFGPSQNLITVPGVEVRKIKEPSNLQDLLQSEHILKSNVTREAIECPDGLKACVDGSKCLNVGRFCDNEIDCNDGSDEMFCNCKDRVGILRQCDGYVDCPNGEDEDECFDCRENEFSCDDWSRTRHGTCIPLSQRCDGIKNCDITGKDEEDCSILTDHLAHHPLHQVSNAVGFLHRNYKGVWYPTCFGVQSFSLEVCRSEAGPSEILPKAHLIEINQRYSGSYVNLATNNKITVSDRCVENRGVFVECPPLYCGLRMTTHNPFRPSEIDTSSEDFLNQMGRSRFASRTSNDAVLGDPRVVGGKASQPAAWPWVVSIYKNGIFHCGGVIINELWIITAAHCVDKFWFFYYEVQAGMLRRFSYSPMEQSRRVTVAIPHEEYDKHSLKNDIALMKLSSPVRYNRYVRPICLPSESTAGKNFLRGPEANTICTTVGWGATVEHGTDPDQMREVEVPILGHCKHQEDEQGDEICAGLVEGGRDACQGDSGGPLMCKNVNNPSQWYLAGIVSHGEGCARPNEPGVYTKVSKNVGWIAENMRDDKFISTVPLQTCPGYVCRGTQTCLPKKRHCDKIVDCLFGDDEINCWQQNNIQVPILGSPKKSNGLISKILDILDLDSKKSAQPIVITTAPSKDSFLNTKQEYFTCTRMLQKILIGQKCDKLIDCEDGSDEENCSCMDYLIHNDKKAICDGITDCKDLSDEVDCVKCLPTQYLCRINQRCIPLENRCDATVDCFNGEDEWDCVALTNGTTLELDSDLRPKQSMKGIITINRSGVWRPLCTNTSTDVAASIATNVCNLLGFEEYTTFHKLPAVVSNGDKPLSVTIDGFKQRYHSSLDIATTTCTSGLFVTCLNVSLTGNIHDLLRDNITRNVELYTVPWNAAIYFNGQFKCIGTIINAQWILATVSCFQLSISNIKLGNVGVLLGKGKAHLNVEGPHELSLAISGISEVNGTDVVLLKTKGRIVFNRYIKPARLMRNIKFSNEKCVAIGVEHDKSQLIFMKSLNKCRVGFKCFTTLQIFDKCTSNDTQNWNGVITCDSKGGWYPAAIFTNLKGSCSFSEHNNFVDITYLKTEMEFAMGGDAENVSGSCAGFTCHLGHCLEKNQVCNGIPDCRSGEDEDSNLCSNEDTHCHLRNNCTQLTPCNMFEMRCKNGKCVPKTVFCDLVNDCGDFSDEPIICSCRTYLELTHPERVCDGIVHCADKSDENPSLCPCGPRRNFKCGMSKFCVSKDMVCDGEKDCPNGKDESICYSLKTNFANPNSGEVIQRTAGIWHSGCVSRNLSSPTELEEICEHLGFAGGSARRLAPPNEKNVSSTAVAYDDFSVVWIRHKNNKIKLQMRTGYKPYVTFVEDLDGDCIKLYIECS